MMYCRCVPETSMLNIPLAGHVAAPQPPVLASDFEAAVEASVPVEPASDIVATPLDEPLPPFDEPPLDDADPELAPPASTAWSGVPMDWSAHPAHGGAPDWFDVPQWSNAAAPPAAIHAPTM